MSIVILHKSEKNFLYGLTIDKTRRLTAVRAPAKRIITGDYPGVEFPVLACANRFAYRFVPVAVRDMVGVGGAWFAVISIDFIDSFCHVL